MEPDFVKGDSRNLPYIDTVMIHLFYKDNPNFVSAEVRNVKRQRAARAEYGDDAIGFIQIQRKDQLSTVKAKVTPEHRVRDKPYDVTVIVNEDEEKIVSCECHGCTASLGGCKHSVALLFWLYRKSQEPSTTSVECYWRASSLSKISKTIKSLSLKEMFNGPTLPPKNNEFLANIVAHGKEIESQSTLLQHYLDDGLKERISIHNLMLSYCKEKEVLGEIGDANEFILFCQENMTDGDCRTLMSETELQSKSSLWYEARFCRITASKLYEAAKCKTYERVLTERIFGSSKVPQTEPMIRGLHLEESVMAEIKKKYNINFKKCGIILRPDYPLFGASPDAISSKYCVEIKCPTKEKI